MKPKPLCDLPVRDIQERPIWEFVIDQETEPDADETYVRPISEPLPVTDLGNRVVGARIRLNNGEEHWAILLNISLSDPRATKQFLSVTVEKDGDFFALARYFDLDFGSSGPKQLAEFLGLRLNDIFPISYDIATLALGDPRVLSGSISTEPDERLPDDERSKLAVWSGK